MSDLKEIREEEFVNYVKDQLKKHKMHTIAQMQLASYLDEIFPKDYSVPEIIGVIGGRNDLVRYSYNSHCAVFEFFFSPSQVDRDLLLLERHKAEIKIAILLDKEVNPKLAKTFFHKRPDALPYIWLSDLMITTRKEQCLRWLRIYTKLTDESQLSLYLQGQPLLNPQEGLTTIDGQMPGQQVLGLFESSGQTLEKAASKIMKKAAQLSKKTPVSVTVSVNQTSSSLNSEIHGDTTVQY